MTYVTFYKINDEPKKTGDLTVGLAHRNLGIRFSTTFAYFFSEINFIIIYFQGSR